MMVGLCFIILLNALLKPPKAHANFNKSSFYHIMVADINKLQAYFLHFDAFFVTQLGQQGC